MHINETHSTFPTKLYLQLDNTARENKNKTVMEFLTLLVQQGVFAEVIVVILFMKYFGI